MGLLPVIAAGVDVSLPAAGLLVSAYAIGVMIGAPLMTLALARLRRRSALMLLMGIFTAGNLLSAIAPDYGTLLAARLVTSLNHGAFFGLGSIVAASVVPPERRASAVAAMFMGLTIANVGGVPAATWIGQQVGWRMAFAGTAGLGLLAIAALWRALPKGTPGEMPDLKRELRVLARPAVLIAMATTVAGAGAMFTLYTFIAPVLADLTGAGAGFVTLALVLIGVGFTLGNGLGGRLADWSLDGATRIFLAALAVIMLALPLALTTEAGAIIGLLVWGAAAFAIVPPVQMRVMQAAAEAPGLASSINVAPSTSAMRWAPPSAAPSSASTSVPGRSRSPARALPRPASPWPSSAGRRVARKGARKPEEQGTTWRRASARPETDPRLDPPGTIP
ncbi:Inner membrane transport protein YdhP [Methylobrevis pamukkalensis]|uniref:Inner membrane transport protein YdhP n=1 Tax=Methylobrevis pamukkalensis TaxID=1439726 RepID=A0A1E3H8D4_9HYPH|nr:Inner membrane transport protein YdhP [Methylobrevis pamukkalensis]